MVYDKLLIPVILNLPLLKSFSFNNFAIKYNATFKIEFPYQNIVENSDVIRRIFFHRHLIDTKFPENKNNNETANKQNKIIILLLNSLIFLTNIMDLTYFMPLISFDTPWKWVIDW